MIGGMRFWWMFCRALFCPKRVQAEMDRDLSALADQLALIEQQNATIAQNTRILEAQRDELMAKMLRLNKPPPHHQYH